MNYPAIFNLNRRLVCVGLLSTGLTALAGPGEAREALKEFEDAFGKLSQDPELADTIRGKRETIDDVSVFERAPIRARKSETKISEKATELIIASEVTSKAQYEKKYAGVIWPKYRSGITVGIGYDVGYVSPAELEEDWKRYIPETDINELKQACGVKGGPAQDLLEPLKHISIPWDAAILEYKNETQKRYVGATEENLPNASGLSPHSLGALVSLGYNRGLSYSIPREKDREGRYEEMRNIKKHMTNKDYAKIPDEIRAMKRLWVDDPSVAGVLVRRDAEAALFEYGLNTG